MTTAPPPKRLQPWPFPLPPPPPPPPPPLPLANASPAAAIEAVVSARAATAMVRIFLDFADMSFLLSSCWDRATTARSVIRTCGEARIDDVTVVTGTRFSSRRRPAHTGVRPGILPFPRPGLTPSYRTEPLADSAMGRANGKIPEAG